MVYDAVVVGGGLAGCSSAIQIATRGHRVLLVERKRYPAHKLCGEFLSVEVQSMFRRIGVMDEVLGAGAREVTSAFVTSAAGASYRTSLPGTALGLSRYRLDPILIRRAEQTGVDVRQGVSVTDVTGSLDEGFEVSLPEQTVRSRVVLGAYGKRETLDRKLDRSFLDRKEQSVAFKAHFSGVDLGDAIEMHAFAGGYCGLSHVEDGLVNACWIAGGHVLKACGGDPDGMIAQVFTANPFLRDRFARLHRVTEYSAVSQVSFAVKGKFDGDVCMVGDAAGMIAPVCGNGMAMALRSAELAAPVVSDFLTGAASAHELRSRYERQWNREFGTRMRLGRLAQVFFSHPLGSRFWVAAFRAAPAVGDWFIRSTRSTAQDVAGGARPAPASS